MSTPPEALRPSTAPAKTTATTPTVAVVTVKRCQYERCTSNAVVRCWQCALYLCNPCLTLAHESVVHRAGSIVPLEPEKQAAVTAAVAAAASAATPAPHVLSFVLLMILCNLPNAFQLGLAVLASDLIALGLENASIPTVLQSTAAKYVIQRVAKESRALVETMRAQADFWLVNGFLLKYHCTIAEIDAADSFSTQSYVYTFCERKMVGMFVKAFERKLVGAPGLRHDEEKACYRETKNNSEKSLPPWAIVWLFPQRSFVIVLEGEKVMLSPSIGRAIADTGEEEETERKRVGAASAEGKDLILAASAPSAHQRRRRLRDREQSLVLALVSKLHPSHVKHIGLMAQPASQTSFFFAFRAWMNDEAKLDPRVVQRTVLVSGDRLAGRTASALTFEREIKQMGSAMLGYYVCDRAHQPSLQPRSFIASLQTALQKTLPGFSPPVLAADAVVDAKVFRDAILAPLAVAKPDAEWSAPRCVVIDCLDDSIPPPAAAPGHVSIASLVLHPDVLSALPVWLRLVVTFRQDFDPGTLGSALLPASAAAAPLAVDPAFTDPSYRDATPALDDAVDEVKDGDDGDGDGGDGGDGERKSGPLLGASRKRSHATMMNDSPPLVSIEALNAKAWDADAILRFRVFTTDFAAELAKAKLLVEYLRPQHVKRAKLNFVRYARRLATLLNAEHFLAPERKRFPPQAGEQKGGWFHRINNVLCVRVIAADRLVEDLRRDLPSEVNAHGDKVYSVPVDGAVYPVLPQLARVFLMGDVCYLITSVEPLPPLSRANDARRLRIAASARGSARGGAGSGEDSDGDLDMSDPRFASAESKSSVATERGDSVDEDSAPALTPFQQAQAAGDHVRALELRRGIVARVLAAGEDGTRTRRQISFYVHQPLELFWFTCNFFLTARDCCNLSQACVFTFSAIHSNAKYWKRAFQCLGNIPMYINPNTFENDVVPIRRWSIIAMIKRRTEQRVHDYNGQVALALKLIDEKEKAEKLNRLKSQFLQKTHACPLCFQQITFQYQLNSSLSKKNGFGAVFMACDQCCAHQVWSHTQARVIWGFTEGQLQELARYIMSKVKFYCTADLLWLRERKYPYYTYRTSASQITPKQRARMVDLPPMIAMHLTLREHTVDQQGVVWERRINAATGAIVEHPMRPLVGESTGASAAGTATGAQPPPTKRQRTAVGAGAGARAGAGSQEDDDGKDVGMPQARVAESKDAFAAAAAPTMPPHIGDVGVVPLPAFLSSGYNPSFVAFHGSEAVPVLASWVEHPVAKPGSYNPRVFDPRDPDADSSDE